MFQTHYMLFHQTSLKSNDMEEVWCLRSGRRPTQNSSGVQKLYTIPCRTFSIRGSGSHLQASVD